MEVCPHTRLGDNGNLKFLKLTSGCVLVKPPTDRRRIRLKAGGQGMTALGYLNINRNTRRCVDFLMFASMDMRDEFQKWLVAGNAKKISPQVAIECLDKVSEYQQKNFVQHLGDF